MIIFWIHLYHHSYFQFINLVCFSPVFFISLTSNFRNNCPELFFEKDVLKNFAGIAGKILFFNSITGCRPEIWEMRYYPRKKIIFTFMLTGEPHAQNQQLRHRKNILILYNIGTTTTQRRGLGHLVLLIINLNLYTFECFYLLHFLFFLKSICDRRFCENW